ncbi:MAG TPA: acetate kinase [Candidatus Sabulitectum sp.]|nr:acetate kinase [Candidatus Sabulitectum sp.]HPR22155.1 acetate kinase [Candidatus Sabulitectum sp.]
MKILVINSGSSSIKFQVIDGTCGSMLGSGLIERIGLEQGKMKYKCNGGKVEFEKPIPDHETGLAMALEIIVDPDRGAIGSLEEITACGHRVVHGGEKFTSSVLIDEKVLSGLEEVCEMAPLHNPANIMGIRAAMKALPGVPNVAVFDTAFHQTMPMVNYLYGLPYRLYEDFGMRRYGFHGTSHQFVSQRAAEILERPLDEVNTITCHLGNGSSITAVKGGRSIDTSLGFGTFCGVMMGTRSGDVDPAILFDLMENRGWTLEQVKKMVYKESGLLGVSGVSMDMRDVEEHMWNGHERSKLAFEMFADRVRKYIGSYAATLGTLDAVVFTAGIGENGWELRELICDNMDALGIRIDREANKVKGVERIISAPDSSVKVMVIPTNEELMIARETIRLTS